MQIFFKFPSFDIKYTWLMLKKKYILQKVKAKSLIRTHNRDFHFLKTKKIDISNHQGYHLNGLK